MYNKNWASVRPADKFQRSIRCLNRWTLNHWPKFSALISAFWKSRSCFVIGRHQLWSDLPVSSPFLPAHMMWPWWEAASWAWPRPGSSSCGTRRSASSCWRRRKSWVGWAWKAVVVVKEHNLSQSTKWFLGHVMPCVSNSRLSSDNNMFTFYRKHCWGFFFFFIPGAESEMNVRFLFVAFWLTSCAPEWAQQWGHSQRDLLHARLAQGPSVCARGHFSLRVLRQEGTPVQEMWEGQSFIQNCNSTYHDGENLDMIWKHK